MLLFLIGTTIVLAAVTGFADVSEGAFFKALGGQIVQGMISIACLILVGAVFWRFGWKIGLLDLLLVIVASNVGLTLHGYFRRRSALSSYPASGVSAPPSETHEEGQL